MKIGLCITTRMSTTLSTYWNCRKSAVFCTQKQRTPVVAHNKHVNISVRCIVTSNTSIARTTAMSTTSAATTTSPRHGIQDGTSHELATAAFDDEHGHNTIALDVAQQRARQEPYQGLHCGITGCCTCNAQHSVDELKAKPLSIGKDCWSLASMSAGTPWRPRRSEGMPSPSPLTQFHNIM